MTREEKDLLIKDLCARLPYGVKIQVYYEEMSGSGYFDETVWVVDNDEPFHVNDRRIENIKPYLRPMSSMTEEERAEMGTAIQKDRIDPYGEIKNFGEDNLLLCTIRQSTNLQDCLNAHHFDYRGLIKRGLALEAPEGMYNTK